MGMRVVIADDEVVIRMYIREILESNGYEVVGEAEDGMDAVMICREKKPDFVIMDINMPVMSGLEATEIINEEKLTGFVIALTAYRDREIAEKAIAMDIMGYVVKPVDEDTLIPAIRIAEHKYQQMKEIEEEVNKTRQMLNNQKYIDRAKGVLMERRNLTEKEAYAYIRKLAMDKRMSMTDVAKMFLKVYEG